jgi:hypothetical protein
MIMVLLNIVGIVLIIIGIASGIALYINSINGKIENITSLVVVFCCCLIGGSVLYSMGTDTHKGFVFVSYYLFSLGGVSAITLFFTEIGVFDVKSKNTLWIFFILGILLGANGIYSL